MIIKGKVMKGMGIGAKLGYPTANIECEGCESGVYVAQVVVDGVSYKSVAVVGVRENLVEVLLLNFNGNLYNKEIQVEIFDKVSEIETFDNQEALIKKIESDIRKVLCLQE